MKMTPPRKKIYYLNLPRGHFGIINYNIYINNENDPAKEMNKQFNTRNQMT